MLINLSSSQLLEILNGTSHINTHLLLQHSGIISSVAIHQLLVNIWINSHQLLKLIRSATMLKSQFQCLLWLLQQCTFTFTCLISYQFIFKIHAGLNDWSTGKCKSSEWNAEAYNSTYLSNVEFFQESILDVDRSKFHCLMAKLYQLAS